MKLIAKKYYPGELEQLTSQRVVFRNVAIHDKK